MTFRVHCAFAARPVPQLSVSAKGALICMLEIVSAPDSLLRRMTCIAALVVLSPLVRKPDSCRGKLKYSVTAIERRIPSARWQREGRGNRDQSSQALPGNFKSINERIANSMSADVSLMRIGINTFVTLRCLSPESHLDKIAGHRGIVVILC